MRIGPRHGVVLALIAAVAVCAPAGAVVPSDGISRVVGTGAAGNGGDGGPAVLAQLDAPQGVAVDAQGRTYIADGGNGRVRRVDGDGVIRPAAGPFGEPADVAVDAQGRLLVAGASDNVVYAVSPAGAVTVFAGTGAAGSAGDAGPAVAAEVDEPRGVAVDAAGNVYIAETGGHRIRAVGADGVIRTIAGTGAAGFGGDGGQAVSAQLLGPRDVAVAPDGSLVVVDSGNGRVRRVGADGIIRSIAGNGDFPGACPASPVDAGATPLDFPTSAAVDGSGNVYVASQGCVAKVTATGTIQRIAGDGSAVGDSGDGGPAASARLQPSGLAVDPTGSLVIAAGLNNKVRRVLNVAPTASFTASAPAPLTVATDAASSSAGQAGESLSLVAWSFGDGAGAQGTTARHVYGAAGTYLVTLTVRDDSGATATTSRAVTVPPPPIAVTITSTAVAGRYRPRALAASLVAAGTTTGPGTIAVRLTRASGPRAVGMRTTADLRLRLTRAGAFSARARLPGLLAPGSYEVTLDGAPVAGRAGTVRVARPPAGILRRSFISAIQRNGAPATSFPRPVRRLFCHFDFAVLPLPGRGRPVSTQWRAPGAALGRVRKPIARRVVGVLARPSGLGAGRYACTLRVGPRALASVAARIR